MHVESSDVIFSAATQRNGGETEEEEEKWRGEEGPICLKCTADARHERQPNQDTHRASPVGSTELGSGSADRQAGRQADGDRASISSALFTR